MNLRKLDKLILRSFIGPLVLTLFVVVFILLTQLMLNKMDEFVGKDLGVIVLSELMFYFSINLTQTALPLAVLLSSLMAFGNLGEYSELTAIKGAGISLLRAMRPAFILTLIITILAFFNNNFVVTKANLKAYSLLYDIKKHKPSLDIKEGTFYNGIPEFSIKVNKKYPDGETLGDIIIYNHSGNTGNNIVTLADSGRMYSVLNNRYLMFELFQGKRYEELPNSGAGMVGISNFVRNDFSHQKLVLSLASFDFKKSREDLWTSHYYMKNIAQLKTDVDSMSLGLLDAKVTVYDDAQRFFSRYYRDRVVMPENYAIRKQYRDSIQRAQEQADSIKYRENYNRNGDERIQFDSIDMIQSVVAESSSDTPPATTSIASADQSNQELAQNEGAAQRSPQTVSTGQNRRSDRREVVQEIQFDSIDFNRNIQAGRSPIASLSTPPSGNVNNNVKEVPKKNNKPKDLKAKFSKINQIPNSKNAKPAFDRPSPKLSARDSLKLKAVSEINVDSILSIKRNQAQGLRHALSEARNIKNKLSLQSSRLRNQNLMITKYRIEVNKKYAQAFACLVMFLIGAPLGSIIKKGGLGVPVIISIVFFILYYVMSITGKKWAEEDVVTPFVGIWGYSFILLPVGFFFLRQAKNDARLLESDFYAVWVEKIKQRFSKNRDQP